MPPKATTTAAPPPEPTITGKWLIIGVVTLALIGASGSWLFRYSATHRPAKFWGSEAARLIRDAPKVTLYEHPLAARSDLVPEAQLSDVSAINVALQKHMADSAIDVSQAPGLAHLRNALLEDWNFEWPEKDKTAPNPVEGLGYWWLEFEDPASSKSTTIWFSQDCRQAARIEPKPDGSGHGTPISTAPIAAGLREIFDECVTRQKDAATGADSRKPANTAAEATPPASR